MEKAGHVCPRCGGQAVPDLDGDYSCLQCGYIHYPNVVEVKKSKFRER